MSDKNIKLAIAAAKNQDAVELAKYAKNELYHRINDALADRKIQVAQAMLTPTEDSAEE